ncbi:hypothetical protein SAMN04488503_1685 [Humidesulfovibrio mexicanus]|uniref:Uncharacterized protein n=1 Tax=Humidesulfovibrio mexicanus TaxID=147047 RepID=A0A238ZZ11_9BACT|nr:hypothetical protein [Humidesulfovibrio mexicanus]SNR88024.1 hypothetical protein SAMN04488503_1685 [Humidesulfovibrio mexicanus]
MRKVVDSNMLTSPALRHFFQGSHNNYVLISEYAAMEAYCCDSITGIYKSMKIISEFPKQVLVLNNTINVCGFNGKAAGLQRRLIDTRQTRDFQKFAKQIQQAQSGDRLLQQELFLLSKKACENIKRILRDAESMAPAFDIFAKTYSAEERNILRTDQAFTQSMLDKSMRHIMEIAVTLFSKHPRVVTLPNINELANTFIFRVSLCTYLLALEWGVKGGAQQARPKKIRNDLIDMHFAAYATFFDGFLSADAKANRIYNIAMFYLKNTLLS